MTSTTELQAPYGVPHMVLDGTPAEQLALLTLCKCKHAWAQHRFNCGIRFCVRCFCPDFVETKVEPS